MGFSLVVEGEMEKHQQEHSVAIERMCLPQFAWEEQDTTKVIPFDTCDGAVYRAF